jgi:hypothetical protein
MSKRICTIGLLLLASVGIASAGTIDVYNSDSQVHTVELNCSGSKKSIEIKGSTTTAYTFHSTSKECEIIGGTVKFPTKTLVDGAKWKIKDGVATPR